MNQKPDMPGDDERIKRHPARLPSDLEVDRKLKPNAEGEENSAAKTDRVTLSRERMRREIRRDVGNHAA